MNQVWAYNAILNLSGNGIKFFLNLCDAKVRFFFELCKKNRILGRFFWWIV